jgi:hypothetical protein
MVALALNQTVSTQKTASIAVDGGLAPGRYRIQLVVTDTTNGQSPPTFVQVSIVALPPPPPPQQPPVIFQPQPPVVQPPVLQPPIVPPPIVQPPIVHPPIVQPQPPIIQPHPPIN